LTFVGQAHVQERIAQMIGQSSPHNDARQLTANFAQLNKTILSSSKGVAQFFDRDLKPEMVTESLDAIITFVNDADVEKVITAMERIRLSVASKVKH